MGEVVSVRIPKEVKEEIEKTGLNLYDFAKKAIIGAWKREKHEQALRWIKEHRLPPSDKRVVDLIREDRDAG